MLFVGDAITVSGGECWGYWKRGAERTCCGELDDQPVELEIVSDNVCDRLCVGSRARAAAVNVVSELC